MTETRLGEKGAFRVLDKFCFFSVAKKDVGLLQLSAERGLGSGRMGEGTSCSGEAESGDPPGVRRVEQVSARAGADLSAAGGVK